MKNELKTVTVKYVCPECLGAKRLYPYYKEKNGVIYTASNKCPVCAGTGKLIVLEEVKELSNG